MSWCWGIGRGAVLSPDMSPVRFAASGRTVGARPCLARGGSSKHRRVRARHVRARHGLAPTRPIPSIGEISGPKPPSHIQALIGNPGRCFRCQEYRRVTYVFRGSKAAKRHAYELFKRFSLGNIRLYGKCFASRCLDLLCQRIKVRLGARGDGTLHELDVIVYATGFKADRFMRPMRVTGRKGTDLDSFWGTRATAYLAVTMPNFPNFFMLNGPTGPVGNFSLIDIAEQQWGYMTQLLGLLRSGEYSEIRASRKAMTDYETRRIEASKTTIWATGCSSWYLDKEGVRL